MQIFDKNHLPDYLKSTNNSPEEHINSIDRYIIPAEGSSQVALAKYISSIFQNNEWACLKLEDWGISESLEHIDLYNSFRKSFGIDVDIIDAPYHVFINEDYHLVSALIMVLLFGWDAQLFNEGGEIDFRFSHHGFMDVFIEKGPALEIFSGYMKTMGLKRVKTVKD